MPETIQAHRLFTAAPVDCECHTDRAQPVPRFAAEAIPSTPIHARIIDSLPPPPPDINPLTWLAVVGAAVAAINDAAQRLEDAKNKKRRPRARRNSDKLHRLCNVCAADLQAGGFSHREASMVYDLDGKMRMTTLQHTHARAVAQAKADKEGRDMVLLTVPVFIATRAEATRQELVRPGRRPGA